MTSLTLSRQCKLGPRRSKLTTVTNFKRQAQSKAGAENGDK